MGDRIGRNGRLLGKLGPDIGVLEDEAKKRLLEMSGIPDDDIGAEERDDIVKALLVSNPDFLKDYKATSQSSDSRMNDEDIEGDEKEATQPPDQVVEVDSDVGSGRDKREDQEEENVSHSRATHECYTDQNETNIDSVPSQVEPPDQNACEEDAMEIDCPETSNSPKAATARQVVKIAFFEEDGVSENSEDQDEETQPYDAQLVEDTQRAECIENEADLIVPESPENNINEDAETPLQDKRFNKELKESAQPHTGSPQTLDINLLLKTLNPLLPASCSENSSIDKDSYSQVVRLVFDLYRKRCSREQRRLKQSMKWGPPVGVGSHVDDCLRCKGSKKAPTNIEIQEGSSRESRLLRRYKNDWLSSKTKEDPYTLNISDEDKNYVDDDFQTSSHQATGQRRTWVDSEQNAYDLIMGGSTRKSARLCTKKLAQSREFESDENDTVQEEWIPEQRRPKRKIRNLKRKAVNNTQKKDNIPQERMDVVDEEVERSDNQLTEDRKTDEDEAWSKEISELQSCLNYKDKSMHPKIQTLNLKDNSNECGSPFSFKRKYKFNSSEDEENHQNAHHDSFLPAGVDEHKNQERVIVLTDSEQSNDVENNEQKKSAASSHSFKLSKGKYKVFPHNLTKPDANEFVAQTTSNSDSSSTKPYKKVEGDVQTFSKQDSQCLRLREEGIDELSTKFQSKILKTDVLLRVENKTSDDGKEISQDHTEGPNWSQDSNSLLDKDGLLFSTQIKWQEKNMKKSNNSTENSKFESDDMKISKSGPNEDMNSQLNSSLKAGKDLHRKRKAPGNQDSTSKRQAPSIIIPEETEELQDRDRNTTKANVENESDTFLSLRNKLGWKKNRPIAEKESDEEVPRDLSIHGRNIPGHDTENKSRQTIGEGQDLPVPSGSREAADNSKQASFREELNNAVDEKALQACPICGREFPLISIEAHASTCGEEEMDQDQQEIDERRDNHGDTFMQENIICDSALDSSRRQTRSRRGDQRLH